MSTVVIAGGRGTIGRRLTAMLIEKGYKVVILTREPRRGSAQDTVAYAHWNVAKGTIDTDAVAGADYIIHLAGAGVAEGRWTEERKKEIVESRTKSCALLVKVLARNTHNVKAVICSSATGWYGADTAHSSQHGFKEDAPPAKDFLGNTCRKWEDSINPVTEFGVRLVKLRTGIVLANGGGAYSEFRKPLKAGLATIMGSGKQVVSWIHIDDICRMYIYALENENIAGVFNAVAPNPVSNKSLIKTMARQLNGHLFIPVHAPAFMLKLMLGEMSTEILKSVTVSAERIQSEGFTFLYPTIPEAVEALKMEK